MSAIQRGPLPDPSETPTTGGWMMVPRPPGLPPQPPSLLGAPLTAEQRAIMDERQADIDRINVLVHNVVLESYCLGEVTLEWACTTLHKGLADFSQEIRHKAFGVFLDGAMRASPPRKGRGNPGKPQAVRKVAVAMVTLAREREKLTLQREHRSQTAFERAAEILTKWGMDVTPRQVELWWSQQERPPA